MSHVVELTGLRHEGMRGEREEAQHESKSTDRVDEGWSSDCLTACLCVCASLTEARATVCLAHLPPLLASVAIANSRHLFPLSFSLFLRLSDSQTQQKDLM